MQLLLSCAKTMTERSSVPTPRTTRPAYRSEASELAAGLATLPTDELARLLRVNRRIAAENRLRYGRFHGDDDAAIPALTAYTGIVFKRIDPASFTDADFEYAQRHLNITSFLYGLLRPLDAIRTYRLEGDAVLPGRGDETMFSYWQSRLTDDLLGRIHADDGILVNLASGEMKRLFDWKRVCREARVITPEFRVREGDRLKTVVVYTKMCRGEMTRQKPHRRSRDAPVVRMGRLPPGPGPLERRRLGVHALTNAFTAKTAEFPAPDPRTTVTRCGSPALRPAAGRTRRQACGRCGPKPPRQPPHPESKGRQQAIKWRFSLPGRFGKQSRRICAEKMRCGKFMRGYRAGRAECPPRRSRTGRTTARACRVRPTRRRCRAAAPARRSRGR